ncbi:MAG: DNA-formamidopyrimidine glycosylase [Isosphaeraceae bacterium]
MPELPEVETMVRGLRSALGDYLERIEVVDPFLLERVSAEDLERRAAGAAVRSVQRRGKWVVIELDPPRGLIVIQPRMTGGFCTREPDRPEHIRLIFHAGRPPRTIGFRDTRRLGKIGWHADMEAAEAAFARSHGPDALVIGREDLADRLRKTSRGIKPTLLDQKVLAGVGNIYADEILFRSGLHPERPSSSLTKAEVTRLHAAIRPVLEKAIELEGSSFDGDYRTLLGQEGGYLPQAWVHRRKGEPCRACGRPIVKTRIAGLIGRPTYLCTACQKPGRAGRKSADRLA